MSYHNNLERLSIKLALTSVCNLNCVYCGGSHNRTNFPTPAAMEDYRSTNVSEGNISSEEMLDLLGNLRKSGFASVRPTGGEPTLRNDWDSIIEEMAELGYVGIDITTNGTTLSRYLDTHNEKLPKGLSTVKVSLDTYDPEEYKQITGGGDINKLIDGVSRISDKVWVRANTVVLRKNLNQEKIRGLINFCQSLGMKQIQFLDLVYYPNLPGSDPDFWEKEFVAWPEFIEEFEKIYPGIKFEESSGQFGVRFFQTKLDNGFVISFKDSTYTMRDAQCNSCKSYCQEGRCLIRIGTDGNVTFCPDYPSELYHFNGVEAVKNNRLEVEVDKISKIVESSVRSRTIDIFARKHNLKLPIK